MDRCLVGFLVQRCFELLNRHIRLLLSHRDLRREIMSFFGLFVLLANFFQLFLSALCVLTCRMHYGELVARFDEIRL